MMIRAILPLGFAAFCLMIGNAAIATVSALQEAEAVEWCHRQPEGSESVCGPLPGSERR